MKNKLVSVIVPVYNVEKYLKECLQSLLNQTYYNLEIILVNDGSTDSSSSICDEYANKDSRIIVIHKENGGLSSARNAGLNKSTGDYVFFLDSDDLLQNNAIELLYNCLNEDESSIVMCELEKFKKTYHFDSRNIIVSEFTPINYFNSILELNSNTYACGCLIPKKIIGKHRFINNRYFEDMGIMYYLYHNCCKIFKINLKLYKYRFNPNSIIHTINVKKVNDYILSANEMTDFLKKNYSFSHKKINTFLAFIYRECYIMSKDLKYLIKAKKLSQKSSIKGLSIKNKIKILLLKSISISRLLIKIKNG